MSPLTRMQAYFEAWSDLKLTLKMENFIKEWVSLIWRLSTIFTEAVGRILTTIQQWSWIRSGHSVPFVLWPKLKTLIISQILHTMSNSHDQKHILLWWCTLGTYSTFIIYFADNPEHFYRIEMCLRATTTLVSKLMPPKLVWRCANRIRYHNL